MEKLCGKREILNFQFHVFFRFFRLKLKLKLEINLVAGVVLGGVESVGKWVLFCRCNTFRRGQFLLFCQ